MRPLALIFGLLALLAGSRAQHSVTQEPSVTASPGQTVKLPCTLGGGLTVSSNSVRFFQHKLGQVPRYLLYYVSESNKHKGTGVPDRFVGSGSGSVGYLTINGVQKEDDADYYCLTWTGSQCTVVQVNGEVRLEPLQPRCGGSRCSRAGPAVHLER